MGLLDNYFTNMSDPAQQGLLAAAASLLNSSGASRVPISMGQALGQGLMAGNQGYLGALNRKMELAKAEEERKLSDAQINELNAKAYNLSNPKPDFPTSYNEWSLAGKPGAYADWLKQKHVGSTNDYSVPVYLEDGSVAAFDTRRKTLTPLGAKAAQFSPGLKGKIAESTAAGKEIGEGAGKATVALAGMNETKDAAINSVDELLKHPGFESYVGMTLRPFASYVDGTPEADFKARLDQTQGGAFLTAYETLKGGGQITEIEGKKATDAINRMKKSTSEDEFKLAAKDYKDAIERGFKKLEAKSNLTNSKSPTKQIVREVKLKDGRIGVEYSDGTRGFK